MGIPTQTLKAIAADPDCNPASRSAINAGLRRGGRGRADPAAPPARVRGLVGGDESVSIWIAGLRVVNPLNGYGRGMHWRARQNLKAHQADMVGLFVGRTPLPAPPARVRLVRVYAKGRRPMDPDGLAAAFKRVQDSVACLLGVDDGDAAAVAWEYGQEQGPVAGVRIEVKAVRP